jgi:hypothetical protein
VWPVSFKYWSGLFLVKILSMSQLTPEDLVIVISPQNPNYDTLAAATAPAWKTFLKEAKRYTAIIENRSPRNVVGFSIVHRLRRQDGNEYRETTHFQNPDAVSAVPAKSESGLVPVGQRRVVGQGFSIGRHSANAENGLLDYVKFKDKELSRADNLSIELDAVVYDDGYVSGPDELDLAGKLTALVSERRAVYKTLLEGIGKNLTMLEMLPFLGERPRPADTTRWSDLARDSSTSQAEYLIYTYDRDRDDLRQILDGAIKKPPFAIHRKTP